MHAAAKGHHRAMVILLQYHADVSLKDKKGRTALVHAVRNNHKDAKQVLAAAAAMTKRFGIHKSKVSKSQALLWSAGY
jgi:ankyrin repeat protein